MQAVSNTIDDCRVYWGSHACRLQKGHDGHHLCTCALDEEGNLLPAEIRDKEGIVGAYPYYGPGTNFYGEDSNSQKDSEGPNANNR